MKNIIILNKKVHLFNTLLPCLISFILARVFVEWHLLSRIGWQTSEIYNFMWLSSGYFMTLLLVFWVNFWETYHYKLIGEIQIRKGEIRGFSYSRSLLLYSLSSCLLLSYFISLAYNISYRGFDLNNLINISLSSLYETLNILFLIYSIIIISIFSKPIFSLLRNIPSYLLIYIIGGIWFNKFEGFNPNHYSLLSNESSNQFFIILSIFSLYIIQKILFFCIKYHTKDNNISDWKSYTIPKLLYKDYSIYLIIFPIIFSFIIGIYY